MMEEVSLTKVQHVQLLAIVTALLLMRDTEPGVYNGRVVACEADELIAECEHLVFPLLPKREVGWL